MVKCFVKELFSKFFLFLVIFVLVFTVPVNNVEAAPEPYQFENSIKSNTVDLSTGDMSLSLPLFSVPQPGGGAYPISLNYRAGIKLDQQASWVGLGWDLGVDSITRQVNHIPDDALPNNNNYAVYSKYPPRYPTSKFKAQIDQLEEARSDARFNSLISFGTSAYSGNYLSMIMTTSNFLNTESSTAANFDELKNHQNSIKNQIDLRTVDDYNKMIDGLIFTSGGEEDFQSDFYAPDTYLVRSNAYSGPLMLVKKTGGDDGIGDEAFIPSSYSGELETRYGAAAFIDKDYYGYIKDYNNAMLTDTSTRIITDVDVTTESSQTINGYELVDVSGNHYVFDKIIDKSVAHDFPEFLPSNISGLSVSGNYVDFTWNNRFPGGYLNNEPQNLYEHNDDQFGSAHWLKEDYNSLYGLGAIIGPTYIDSTGVGHGDLTYHDTGSWVKFNYDLIPMDDDVYTVSNSQRVSLDVGDYYGFEEDFDITSGGQKFVTRSFKSYSYLKSIETHTHKAEFYYSFVDRYDGKEVFSTNGTLDGHPKLNRIVLKKRIFEGLTPTEDFIDLEKYEFEYDHSLVYGAPDNLKYAQHIHSFGETYDCESGDNWKNCGRLTLKSLNYSVCDDSNGDGDCDDPGEWNNLPSFKFEYGNGDSPVIGNVCSSDYTDVVSCLLQSDTVSTNLADTKNPIYIKNGFDRWGHFYLSDDVSNIHNHNGRSNPSVDSWSLTKVNWPNGGLTEWEYEEDRYKYLNNWYSDPVQGVQKEDTHYGGGIRVKAVNHFDGFGGFYKTGYAYLDKDVSDVTFSDLESEEDGHYAYHLTSTSSGVAMGEPSFPIYSGDFTKLLNNPEDSLIEDGVPAVIYSKVFSYIGDSDLGSLFPYGVIESKFTNPMSPVGTASPPDSNENYVGHGEYSPETTFGLYDLAADPNDQGGRKGRSEARGSAPSGYIHPFGADFVIRDGIWEDDVNQLLIESNKPYLVTSDVEGYFFFLRLKSRTHDMACGDILGPWCHGRAKLQNTNINYFEIDETCPGDEQNDVYCGQVKFGDLGKPEDSEWNVDCCCGDIGDIFVFCDKDGIDNWLSDHGHNTPLRSNSNWVGITESAFDYGWSEDDCDGPHGNSDNKDYIQWDTLEWQDNCYHVYGGHTDWEAGEDVVFVSNIDTHSCSDWDSDSNCDIIEVEEDEVKGLNKEIPSFKYGLNYETIVYTSDNLFEGVKKVENIFSFDNSEYFNRGNLLVGEPRLIKTTTTLEGVESSVEYSSFDLRNGLPKETKEINSNDDTRRVENTFAYFVDVDHTTNMGKDGFHMLGLISKNMIHSSDSGDADVVFASETKYSTFNNIPANLYLPSKKNVWKDGSGTNDNFIDDIEWQLNSEIVSYDSHFTRPTDVRDAYEQKVLTSYGTGGQGECGGDLGLYPTCVENELSHQVKTYYDDLGRVMEIKDANDFSTHFVYDEYSRLEGVRDTVSYPNNLVEYEYNYGMQDEVTCPDGLDENDDACMNYVGTKTLIDTGLWLEARSYVDGLGRHMQSSVKKDVDTSIVVDTVHNNRGLVDQVSEPFEWPQGRLFTVIKKFFGKDEDLLSYHKDTKFRKEQRDINWESNSR
jgi:YD repeat-containing protein